MPRKSRLFIQGLPHLIQLRGHNSQPLFIDNADYLHCLGCLDKALQSYNIRLYGYSLTPARVLLLLGASDKQQLGRFMQHLGRKYVPFYNQKYHRHGALWESRYDSCPIEAGSYFLLVKKFVEQPSQALPYHSFADHPAERIFPHSEYLNLGVDAKQRRRLYREFCKISDSPALLLNIRYALEQNCLLATAGFSRPLEQSLQRRLRPRPSGRPRKHYTNPVVMWRQLENQAKRLLDQYCYREVRLCLLEQEHGPEIPPCFSRRPKSTPVTHHSRLLRDGTESCLQLVARHQKLQHGSKLWYLSDTFHHGGDDPDRLRQWHQLGVEAFGYQSTPVILEQLQLLHRLFRNLGIDKVTELRVNTPGKGDEFRDYCDRLRLWYQPLRYLLTPQQQQWSENNPIRLLQNPENDPLLSRLNQQVPSATDYLSEQSRQQFTRLCQALNQLDIPYIHDHSLLCANHYNTLVFEWHSNILEDHSLLSRGGCYDENASRVTGNPLSACGFTLMFDNLMQLMVSLQKTQVLSPQADVVIIAVREENRLDALLLGRKLRQHFPQLSIINDCSALRLPTRRKNAFCQGARVVLQVGDVNNDLTLFTPGATSEITLPITDVISQLSRLVLSC